MREHQAVVEALLATIRDCPPDAWARPRAEGKWSPAETVEHLALAYRALLADLAGKPIVRRRSGPVLTFLLRWLLLPHIFFHRSFPIRATAPRETRPGGAVSDPAVAARELSELAERIERELAVAGDHRVLHPYFGRLDAGTALRFCAVHVEHHHRQIASATRPDGAPDATRSPL